MTLAALLYRATVENDYNNIDVIVFIDLLMLACNVIGDRSYSTSLTLTGDFGTVIERDL